MKYRAVKGFCRGAGVDVSIGDVIELMPQAAREFVFYGYIVEEPEDAAPAPDAEVKHPESSPGAVVAQENEPQSREPKPARAPRR